MMFLNFLIIWFWPFSIAFDNISELLAAKTHRPPTTNGQPLEVHLGMYLESLGNFRSTEMVSRAFLLTFDVDLYVYMSWLDMRLKHRGVDYVMLNDDDARRKMWLPDLYFANARSATFQTVTRPNFNIFVAPDGQIAYSCRCTLTVACSLDLRFYPMDHQVCSIRVLSYAHIASQVNVSWFTTNSISVNPEIFLPEFKITHLKEDYCNGTYRYALMPNSSKLDDFSCLSGKIYLSRSLGYNILQSYIPTSLIVMISWVSFWIDRRAVPARVTLSFTTLVSFTTLGSGLRFGLAQVSYAKAIDIWWVWQIDTRRISAATGWGAIYTTSLSERRLAWPLRKDDTQIREAFQIFFDFLPVATLFPILYNYRYGACLMFVFMALLEFALINNCMRKAEKFENLAKRLQEEARKKGQEKTRKVSQMMIQHSPMLKRKLSEGRVAMFDSDLDDFEQSWGEFLSNRAKPAGEFNEDSIPFCLAASRDHSRRALVIDQNCRILFPTTFCIFNFLYWSYYLIYIRPVHS